MAAETGNIHISGITTDNEKSDILHNNKQVTATRMDNLKFLD